MCKHNYPAHARAGLCDRGLVSVYVYVCIYVLYIHVYICMYVTRGKKKFNGTLAVDSPFQTLAVVEFID